MWDVLSKKNTKCLDSHIEKIGIKRAMIVTQIVSSGKNSPEVYVCLLLTNQLQILQIKHKMDHKIN